MQKDDVYKTIKSMTLEELVSIFSINNDKTIENENKVELVGDNDNKVFYTINDLLEKYTFFTRYNLNKAIQDGGLPFCYIGKKRMFSKEEVEKWLENEMKPKKDKNKYDI